MTAKNTALEFSDTELQILNDIVRQNKITLSNEELVLLTLGKRTTPLIDLTVKVGRAWEARASELQNTAAQPAVTSAPVEEVQ